jgi:hypothetical protein
MTVKQEESARGRGKPLGHRSNPALYDDILNVLHQDKDSKGDGMSANAIAQALGQNDMTTRLYLTDLVEQKRVSTKIINARLVLYRLPRAKAVPS